MIMMFYIFVRACEKYNFDFSVNSNSIQAMSLRPKNTFEGITVERDYFDWNFNKLFIKAIKIMKRYRKERGY